MNWKQFFRDWFYYVETGEFRFDGVASNLKVYRISFYTLDGKGFRSDKYGFEADLVTKDFVISQVLEAKPDLKNRIDFILVEEGRRMEEVMRIDGREVSTWKKSI